MSGWLGDRPSAFSRSPPATPLRFTSLCQIASSEKGCTQYYPVDALTALSCGCDFAVRSESIGCSRRSSHFLRRGSLSRPVAVADKETEDLSLQTLCLALRLTRKGPRNRDVSPSGYERMSSRSIQIAQQNRSAEKPKACRVGQWPTLFSSTRFGKAR
ncbi:MAG: hypothetical protein HYX48_05445 [Chlamydiales bacterium]|nr:hypothetical protein [Chlamydiales bacterium]